jgi:hypothetical protein
MWFWPSNHPENPPTTPSFRHTLSGIRHICATNAALLSMYKMAFYPVAIEKAGLVQQSACETEAVNCHGVLVVSQAAKASQQGGRAADPHGHRQTQTHGKNKARQGVVNLDGLW